MPFLCLRCDLEETYGWGRLPGGAGGAEGVIMERGRTYCAAMPYAARCDGRCSALRRPMHRIAGSSSVSYTARKYHDGSTTMHKNRSPRKQGRDNHAIGKRPESASVRRTLPPSTHPKLGVSSRHHGFHRYALQRIFRPSLGNGRSD